MITRSLLALFFMVATAQANGFLGTWETQKSEKNARIEIKDCGGALCGKIVWLQQPTYPEGDEMAGKEKIDRNNKDESKRNRPLMGLEMLSGFTKESDTKYVGGTIYNPEDGDTYKCTLTMREDGQLEVFGFVEILFFSPGKTQLWKRVG